MEKISVLESISRVNNLPAGNALKIIISLKDVYHYLYDELKNYDTSTEFAFAILTILTDEALNYETTFPNSDRLAQAVDSVLDLKNISTKDAMHICRTASELIYQVIGCHIPDYGSVKYVGRVKHYFINDHNVVIEFREIKHISI